MTWMLLSARCGEPCIDLILQGCTQCHSHRPWPPQILRLAVFELVHSDLPDHAISAHVDLCSAAGHRHASSLVNATLRQLLRERTAGHLAAVVPQLPAPYSGEAPEGRKCGLLSVLPQFSTTLQTMPPSVSASPVPTIHIRAQACLSTGS